MFATGLAIFLLSGSATIGLTLEPATGSADTPPPSTTTPPAHETPPQHGYLAPSARTPVAQPARPAQRAWRPGIQFAQVNVDANGHNIPGDAANEPSLAVDPIDPNRMAIGWRQFATIESDFRQAGWAYTQDGGANWTYPGELQPSVFRSDPVLVADADGVFYYNSLTLFGGVYQCRVFRSYDGGVNWPDSADALGGDKQWMVVDRTDGIGRGNLYAYWTNAYSSCDGQFTRSTDGGLTFPECEDIPGTPYWGTLAVGPDGEVYVTGNGFILAKSTTAQDPSQAITWDFVQTVGLGGSLASNFGPNPGGLTGQVWVATNHAPGPHRGEVYLLCSVDPWGPDPLDVRFARSTDGGVTWSSSLRVNDDAYNNGAYQWFGTMAVAPNGRIDVVWNDTRNHLGSVLSELYYAYSLDGGQTFSANHQLSPAFDPHEGWPMQAKMGDYYDMVSDDDGFNLAWAATFNEYGDDAYEQDVYFLRLPFDCNGNGVFDLDDVAGGTSADCNLNQVPDECDLAALTSLDEDNNGVLDECEATVLYVDTSATGSNHGTSWTNAYTHLEDALDLAARDYAVANEIWVTQGVYRPGGPNAERSSTFQLVGGVTVLGGFAGGETSAELRDPAAHVTILSGDLNSDDTPDFGQRSDNAWHVVVAQDLAAPAVLDGLVITGGQGDGGSTFANNGGGIYADASSVVARRCTIAGNQALFGGGVEALNSADLTLESCTLAGNRAVVLGGAAVVQTEAHLQLDNCTCAYNTGGSVAGGVYTAGTGSTAGLRNAILWANADATGSGESAQFRAGSGSTITADYTCVTGWSGTLLGVGNFADDPLLIDPAGADGVVGTLDDDFRLSAGSPGIGAGDPADTLTAGVRDLAGHARVLCGRVDVGAHEFGVGDYSCNQVIDLVDWAGLQNCFAGDGGAGYPPACAPLDFHFDQDVDLADFTAWRELATPAP